MLTYADREALWIVGIDLRATVEIVELIVARHVTAALTEAASEIAHTQVCLCDKASGGTCHRCLQRDRFYGQVLTAIPTNSPPAAAAPDG